MNNVSRETKDAIALIALAGAVALCSIVGAFIGCFALAAVADWFLTTAVPALKVAFASERAQAGLFVGAMALIFVVVVRVEAGE